MEKHENFFERLSRERNITVEEMKQIISNRIEQSLCDPDSEKRKSWEAIPCKGDCAHAREMAEICRGEVGTGRAR